MNRLILTNDDGIDAPGLVALQCAAAKLGRIQVIAPALPHSGCGHTLTTHKPLNSSRLPDGRIAVDGTPADCVRMGLHHLAADADWILSGINAGGNLGVDVYRSGTVAAVREGVLYGRSGVAISQYIARGRAIDWDAAASMAARVLNHLLAQTWTLGCFWNVNLPHLEPGSLEPEIVLCPLDLSPFPLHYRVDGDSAMYTGEYQSRTRQPGTDISVCFGGDIAVTRISLTS